MKIGYLSIGDTFIKEGETFVVIDRDRVFTFCAKVPSDGYRYLFLNEVKVNGKTK